VSLAGSCSFRSPVYRRLSPKFKVVRAMEPQYPNKQKHFLEKTVLTADHKMQGPRCTLGPRGTWVRARGDKGGDTSSQASESSLPGRAVEELVDEEVGGDAASSRKASVAGLVFDSSEDTLQFQVAHSNPS